MSDLTFRVTYPNSSQIMPEADFWHELSAHEISQFADVSPGPVTLEVVDDQGRVCWRAYYKSYRALAQELIQERKGSFDRAK